MFENMYLLNLPPINLYTANLLLPETYSERALRSPLCFCGEKGADRGSLKELWEERMERMKEMVRGR